MRNMKGFTLIELLVVVAIIGILAAIAIPQFAEYRQRGFDARAESDLRNAATAEEAYYVDNEEYTACADSAACQTTLPGFTSSDDVTLSMACTNPCQSFTGSSEHPRGRTSFSWDSATGGLVN
jgi:prepilin-type N-terminal cleavage/methylation domain-containing protein